MSDLNISALLGSPQSKRWAQASKVKNLEDVTIPYPLEVWNYQACDRHDKPTPDCRWHKCGGHPFKHQNKTASFSYIARRSLVGNSTGTGKQQPVTEPVLTPSGWTTMGQLRPGDLVVGQNGRPIEVLSVHPQTERRTYKVTFSDGSWTLAGPDHLWTAGTKSMLHQGYPMKVVTTMDMANSLHRQWSIPMTEPVEFDPQDTLPCDPYLLGIVLGDGHINKHGASTICTDLEIISNLGLPLVRPHETSPYTGYANVPHSLLGDALPPLSRSWEKSIPVSFMRGSSKDRLALLQGLLDSDGSPMRTGGVEFSSTSYELAEQVVELTQSLGGVARRGKPRRTWYTHNGEKRQGKESYRINVKLPPQFIPFRLTRKLAKFVPPTKYLPKRVVRSIERVEDQESVCIRVSAEDSLYLTRNYIVTHNTLSALLTLALAHHYGERIKAIVVVPTISVKQWHAETERWTPGFKSVSIPSKTPKKDRLLTYASKWDVLIMGNHAFTRDVQHINQIDINQVIVDDIDPALSVNNQTWQALSIICNNADLVIDMNATSLQMRLEQLYAASCLIGGQDVWGSVKNFNRNYIRKEKVWITTKIKKNGKEEIGKKPVFQTTGYKNLSHFKKKFDPMSIRITYEDIADDVTIPALVTEQVYLDMTKKQRDRYTELQGGVRTILGDNNMPDAQKAINALTAFTIGSQICAGTFALKTTSQSYEPDGPEASPKLDWIMDKLTDDWTDEKVVVYAKFRGSIIALQKRLENEGIGFSTIWGVETDADVRNDEMTRFWEDPDTKVMIISVSGERSLNLQNASILVMWDLQLNPARVAQIAGRVRRVGSTHKRVFVFELLMSDTQEERYMAALAARQTLFDFVYDVDTEGEDADNLLIQKLDTEQILRLIQP